MYNIWFKSHFSADVVHLPFITQDPSSVTLALSLDNQPLNGRRLRVQRSTDKTKQTQQKLTKKHTPDNRQHVSFLDDIHTSYLLNISASFLDCYTRWCPPGWLGGVVVSVSDSRSRGHGFNSRPVHRQATTLGKLLTPMCLCHQAVQFGTGQRAVMLCDLEGNW